MKKVEHDLLTSKYTEVWHEDEKDIQFNAPHHFVVKKAEVSAELMLEAAELNKKILSGKSSYEETKRFEKKLEDYNNSPQNILAAINFQKGPIKENGVNGVCNEDLIAMVITRLQGFQNSEFSSRDNAMAITKLEEALLWLRKRTMGREARGVEGTSQK